jgi:Flp pilus assembly protein TadG
MRRRKPARDERGAIAIMTAMMIILLCISSGFVVDFGQAWVAKRQMQTAADAAALAAAAAYASTPGICSTMLNAPANATAAKAAADSYRAKNGSSDTSAITAVCDAPTGTLRVTVNSATTSSSAFGALAGTSSTISVTRTATAAVSVSPQVGAGLRPLALCFAQVPSPIVYGQVYRVDFPGDGHKTFPGCPDTTASGDWWTLDCPGERTGATGVLESEVLNGCPDPVSIVSPQDATTSTKLSNSLTGACPSAPLGSQTCLSGDPGQMDAGHIEDSWKALIDKETSVVLPVFCVPPTCTPTTLSGSGTNAIFPVYRLAGVQICGYHFGKSTKYDRLSGACANNPSHYNAQTDSSKDNYLLLVYKAFQTSGGTGGSSCQLGASCDMGVRRTLLVN